VLYWIDLATDYEPDEPDVEAICREGLYVVLLEVVTIAGEYDCIAVYLNAI
jgi:hypothetical protein